MISFENNQLQTRSITPDKHKTCTHDARKQRSGLEFYTDHVSKPKPRNVEAITSGERHALNSCPAPSVSPHVPGDPSIPWLQGPFSKLRKLP